jgi:hypothetical protein
MPIVQDAPQDIAQDEPAAPKRHALRRLLTVPVGVAAALLTIVVASLAAVLGTPTALRPGSSGRTVRLGIFAVYYALVDLLALVGVVVVSLLTFSTRSRTGRRLRLFASLNASLDAAADVLLVSRRRETAEPVLVHPGRWSSVLDLWRSIPLKAPVRVAWREFSATS